MVSRVVARAMLTRSMWTEWVRINVSSWLKTEHVVSLIGVTVR